MYNILTRAMAWCLTPVMVVVLTIPTTGFPDLQCKSKEVKTVVPISRSSKRVTKRMLVTAYSIDRRQCGKVDGITATGRDGKKYDGVASDWRLIPPGTQLSVPGVGQKVVDDTGGAMRRHGRHGIYHIDIRMASKKKARAFGFRWLEVTILNPVKI